MLLGKNLSLTSPKNRRNIGENLKERKPVTLCIAAISNDEVIGVVDTRVIIDGIARHAPKSKLARFNKSNVGLLAAGEIPVCMAIMEDAKLLFAKKNQHDQTVKTAADCYVEARDARFRKEGNSDTDLNVIIIGVDSDGPHIRLVSSKGEPGDWTSTASALAGSGSNSGNLLFKHNRWSQNHEVLARAFSAKQGVAEGAPEVGRETDVVVISQSSYREYSEGDQLIKSLNDLHNQITNEQCEMLKSCNDEIRNELKLTKDNSHET